MQVEFINLKKRVVPLSVGTTMSRLSDIFFLDDPQDGATPHLLLSLGVAVHRAAGRQSPSTAVIAPPNHCTEHTHEIDVVYGTVHGDALVDIRDSADAWIRIVLRYGDRVTVSAATKRRLPPPGTRVVTVLPPQPGAVAASRMSRVDTVAPVEEQLAQWGTIVCWPARDSETSGDVSLRIRFCHTAGSPAEAAANVPIFARPGTSHPRSVVVDLCESFYHLGWVTGTGGSISIRHGNRIFMAPSGVQKERMQPADIFVLDTEGAQLYAPVALPGKPTLKLSQCAPLFQHAFSLRGAGACIHTHDMNAVMATLLAGASATEFAVTHQEMIKGISGHGFTDKVRPAWQDRPVRI